MHNSRKKTHMGPLCRFYVEGPVLRGSQSFLLESPPKCILGWTIGRHMRTKVNQLVADSTVRLFPARCQNLGAFQELKADLQWCFGRFPAKVNQRKGTPGFVWLEIWSPFSLCVQMVFVWKPALRAVQEELRKAKHTGWAWGLA